MPVLAQAVAGHDAGRWEDRKDGPRRERRVGVRVGRVDFVGRWASARCAAERECHDWRGRLQAYS